MKNDAAETLSAASRVFAFGQDTSVMRCRPDDSRKRWRAEVGATDDEKETGRLNFLSFHAAFPMERLKLSEVFERQQQQLEQLWIEAPPQKRHFIRRRIDEARAAEHRRLQLPAVGRPERALPDCEKYFFSYVRGEAHGTVTKMVTKPREQPYDVGRCRGALRAAP